MEPKICRLCLTNAGVIPLFEEKVLIARIAETVSDVSVIEDDGFPDHICSPCESELTIAFCFIKKCQASDKALRELRQVAAECAVDDDDDDIDVKNESDHVYEDAPLLERSPSPEQKGAEERPKVKHKNTKQQEETSRCALGVSCKECGLRLVSAAALVTHRRTHTGEKPFECDQCDRCFSREANLSRHRQLHVRGRRPYTRKIKIDKFTPEQCVICGLLVKSPSAMKIHARTHTKERPYKCDSCEKTFTTKGCLKRHVETNHLQPGQRVRRFICEMCGRSFYRKADIIVHIGTHTGEKPHGCPHCPMRFLQISSLIRHKRVHTGDRPYSCPICSKMFADKSLVSKHMTVHSDVRNHKCHMCSKAFKSNSSLRTHCRLHTNGKDNVCNYCGLTFSTKGNLKTHMRRLHSEKSGQCSVCMKPFANLEEHMRKHSGEKPHVCPTCERAFTTKVSLSSHISFKHANTHKYKCSIGDCTRTFPIPSMLEFHLHKQHTNHTPHVCQYCPKGFFRASDLSRHLKVCHTQVHIKSPID